MPRRTLMVTLLFAVLWTSCGWGAGQFWRDYEPDRIVASHNDQGGHVGTQWIHWQAYEAGTFEPAEVMAFAHCREWSCDPPISVPAAQLAGWTEGNRAVFPYHEALNSALKHSPPRHIDQHAYLIRCRSGWLAVEIGPETESEALAFLLIQKDGRRMALYEHWGRW